MLDVTIGQTLSSGPRFLSPKPLDNALNTATVALPTLPSSLPQLPAQRLFVDVDLDQFNRLFFQTVDTVLGPASAAQAFEVARIAYEAIARGRETLAEEYAAYEVDWLFDATSPFTGTPEQFAVASEVFEQQMRAALMTAYSIDTIVQYDVAWKGAVSPAVDQTIELFGQVEAIMLGSYSWNNTILTATSPSAKSLSAGDQLLMLFTADTGPAPADGVYIVTGTDGGTQFTIAVANGNGTGRFSATRQNAGLSTAHVPIVSSGTCPLTFLYGTPGVADRAIMSMDLRFNITNLQYFLAPPGAKGAARPSLWLQLIDPYAVGQAPHIGPVGTTTDIPIVFRQYPTPPTLVQQRWTNQPATPNAENPIAAHAHWDYVYTYQALLAAQDRINSTVTYNTDLSAASSGSQQLRGAGGETSYTLFEALARANAVIDAIRPVLQTPTAANWNDAVAAFAQSVSEVAANSDWNPSFTDALNASPLTRITDSYVVVDASDKDPSVPNATQTITLTWPSAQGESTYPDVTLGLIALDPAATLQPYPGQNSTTSPVSLVVTVPNAPRVPLGVVQQIAVNALNVLAAENALASVQVERNLITLTAPDQSQWDVVSEFVYKTATVRPSQPVTPFIDVVAPIDVATLPNRGSGAACGSSSAASLCQRIYTLMANLLADPDQSAALRTAYLAAGSAPEGTRRMKMGCSFRFAMPAVSGTAYDMSSLSPLVPIVLARSFDIDGQDGAQLGDFALLFAQAIDQWASANAVAYGSTSEPPGAQLVFDTTLYAALSGADTPVLRFANLTLALADIDPV